MQTARNSIFVQCAHVKKNFYSNLKLVTNEHINPITLFSFHVNTTFINRNEFSLIEPQTVHVNVASDTYKMDLENI